VRNYVPSVKLYDYFKLCTGKLALDITWRVTAKKRSIPIFSTYFIIKVNAFKFIFTKANKALIRKANLKN